jgi:hypothetical protein
MKCGDAESATYYHSREWAEIWESYTNGSIRPYPKTITFSDNIKVIVPVMRRNYYGGIISRYAITGPPFISKYGNWLHKDRLSKDHIELLSLFIIIGLRISHGSLIHSIVIQKILL